MAGQHLEAQARRVVVGFTENGESTIVEDGPTQTRLAGPGNTKCDIWRVAQVPVQGPSEDGLTGQVITAAPPKGLLVRVVTFPPDSEWDRSIGYSDSQGSLPGSVTHASIPGMHSTQSLDILTVISGELHVELEDGGTTKLQPADVLVMQPGAKHAWSNKSDEVATVVTVAVAGATASTPV